MKISIIGLMLLTIILVLHSCKSSKETPNFQSDELVYSLKKGSCFGTCPVFTLEIYGDGSALYNGLMHTSKIGKYTNQVSIGELQKLNKLVSKSTLNDLPNILPSQIMDLPEYTIGYHNGKEYRTIKGKENLPSDFSRLMKRLDDIAELNTWKSITSDNIAQKDKYDGIIKEHLIIELKKDVKFKTWQREFSALDLQLVRKIAPSLDLYLISYDMSKITPEDFLRLMKQNKDVIEAEFDQKVSRRR